VTGTFVIESMALANGMKRWEKQQQANRHVRTTSFALKKAMTLNDCNHYD